MIVSVLVTMLLGFGVITVATIALLNVAGLRVHDLREVKQQGESVLAYTYTSHRAYKLRSSVGKLPRRLTWGATIGVLYVAVCFAFVSLGFSVHVQDAADGQKTAEIERLERIGIVTWAPITGYVMALLWVAGSISRRCYVVLREVEHRRPGGVTA